MKHAVQLGEHSIEADTAEVSGIGAEAAQGAGEQGAGAGGVAALEVVEGGGDLDEGLEEVFLRLREGEPDGFPVLVGEEELAAVVAGKALGERAAGPVEEHGARGRGVEWLGVGIGDGFGFHWSGKSVKIEVL